ncbi:hypothetical protein SY83_12665 [Paenibacillus swuensis]|uniref:Uncharacterized protein n=1 Tax=Paenibacillus swuensis TaxID=1178515 RepID=A0A172TJ45_9BACL|nr:hypothetical protein [Paenibacillus swuensis]ANE46986.1 hypothetical protein SY83_12665 [Paenibacillus swuensis]
MDPNNYYTPNPLNEETARARQAEVERQIVTGTRPSLLRKLANLLFSIGVLVIFMFLLIYFTN